MSRSILGAIAMTVTVITAPLSTYATPIQVIDSFNFIDSRQSSALGPGGVFMNVGVDLTPVAGTTVTAQQGTTTKAIPYLNSPGLPNQFISVRYAYDPALTGAWNITATNAAAPNSPLQFSTLPICPVLCSGANSAANPYILPFINNVATNSLSTTPTFSWAPTSYVIPSGTYANESVDIIRLNSNGGYSIISAAQLNVNASSYSVPAALLATGRRYVISVQTNLHNSSNGSTVEESRSLFSFSPSATPPSFSGSINLPVVDANGQFSFNFAVLSNTPVLLDPVIATGYDFQTGQGDPLFASVTLPNLGNFNYGLYLWDGLSWIFDAMVAPLSTFNFGTGGVDRFRISGIPPSLSLNPLNPTAFETELTFENSGQFTGTMTPLVAAAVPEPGIIPLMGLGLGGLIFLRRVRENRTKFDLGW